VTFQNSWTVTQKHPYPQMQAQLKMRAHPALGWGDNIVIRVGWAVGLSAMNFLYVFQNKIKMPVHSVTCSVQVDHENHLKVENKM